MTLYGHYTYQRWQRLYQLGKTRLSYISWLEMKEEEFRHIMAIRGN
jgi:hypothetical protein